MSGTGYFLEERKLRSIEIEELGAELGRVLVLRGPASGGLVEFGSPNIDACELGLSKGIGKKFSKEASLIGAPTGKIENVTLGGKFGTEVNEGMSF